MPYTTVLPRDDIIDYSDTWSNSEGESLVKMADKLLVVQEYDTLIRQMKRELQDIPLRQQSEESRLKTHKAAVAAAEEALKAQQSALKQQELEAQAQKEKIGKLRSQQMNLKTNKEFKAMESEIQSAYAGISSTEDLEIQLMEKIENAKACLREQQAQLDAESKSVNEDVAALQSRAAGIQAELVQLDAKRKEAAAAIEQDWLTQYERIFARKDVALVPLSDGICGGCHMKLPPYIAHETRRRTAMVSCTNCGRLLY